MEKECIIDITVQPGSRKNEINMECGKLKIRVTAPPSENKANRMCIDFLSERINIPKSSFKIIGGINSRNKRIKIKGITKEELNNYLKNFI